MPSEKTNQRIKAAFLSSSLICLFFFQAFFAAAQTLQKNLRVEELKLESSLKRDFRSGAVDVFTVNANSNSFVEIQLEQNGVDVSLAAIAPNGKTIRGTNAANLWFGPETLVFAAAEAGNYRIEIKAARTGNFAGNYEIRLKSVRPLQNSDDKLFTAFDAIGEAGNLAGRRSGIEQIRETVKKLNDARQIFAETKDSNSEAAALLWAGILLNRSGLRADAINYLEKSLEILRRNGDRAGEAAVLTEAGLIHHYLEDDEKAVSYLNQALAIRQSTLDRLGESSTLTHLCRFYNNTQQFQKGLENCRRANSLRQDGDPAGAVQTFNYLGNIHSNIGDHEKALFYFEQAAAQITAAGNSLSPHLEIATLANLAGMRAEHQRYREAVEFLLRSQKIAQELGNRPLQAGILRNLGEAYRMMKDYPKALDSLERSLKICEEDKLTGCEDAVNTLGNVYAATNQTALARATFLETVRLARLHNNRYTLGEAFYNLAAFENKNEQLIVADNYIKEGIKIFEFLRADLLSKNLKIAFVTTNLNKFYTLQIEILLKLHRLNPDRTFKEEALEAAEKSRARSLLEIIAETGADPDFKTDPQLLQRRRALLDQIGSTDERLWREERKIDESERAEIIAEIQRLSEDYDNLQEEIRRKNPAYAALNEPQILTAREIQEDILDNETALIEYSLAERQSYAWIVTKQKISVANLASRAQINDAARAFYDLLSKQNSTEVKQATAAARLQKLVFAPLAKELAGYKRLVIVADGALQYVPFAAFAGFGAANSLRNDLEFVKAPSISTIAALRKLKKPGAENLLAVMADPVFAADDERIRAAKNAELRAETSELKPENGFKFDNGSPSLNFSTRNASDAAKLARLPFTSREGAAIANEAGRQNTLLAVGFEAARARIMAGELENYRILHFATHGIFNFERFDSSSGLALSFFDAQGKPVNGFLRAQDIYGLRLRADLVVLSACQTAYGKEVEGEGLISLTRSFMYAGAKTVVASLWKIDDAATAEFMRRFYHAMLKQNKTPSAALQQARTEISQIKRWRNPRYWAAFTLQGDWK